MVWVVVMMIALTILAGVAHGLLTGVGGTWGAAIGLSAGATVLTLGLWKGMRMLRDRARVRGTGDMLERLARRDPDLSVLSDGAGRVLFPDRLSGSAVPALLDSWTVDAAGKIAAIIAEVHDTGFARRRFERVGGILDLTVFRAGGEDGGLVWRLSERSEPRRLPDPVANLPMIRFRGDQVSLNTAAHDRIAQAPAILAALGGLDRNLRTGARVVSVAQPDGAEQAVLVCAGAGEDVAMVLLPALTPSPDQSRTHPIDQVPVALIHLDRSGRIARSNAAARKLLGLEPGETPELWRVLEDLGRPVSDWLDDGWAGRTLGRPEIVRVGDAESEHFIQIVLHRSGSDDHLVAILTDATELKSLEARFAQSQKMQAIGQLAGGIAHDFNNLLTAIAGHCDLLLHDRDRFDPAYSDLIQIHQNANRAAALVRQLLAFSRKQKMKKEPVELERLLEQLMHLLARLVGEKIRVTLRHDPDLPSFLADPRQLEQVIMNLVVNARDAMPMGGSIRIETRAVHFDAPLQVGRVQLPPGRYALMRVIDTGLGIRADLLDKIFEPFFTTKRMGEGTGLGLSTVYGIVKQMGGYVFVDSIEGAGTTFSLYFAADAAGPRLDVPAPKGRNEATDAPALGPARPLPPKVSPSSRPGRAPLQPPAGQGAGTLAVSNMPQPHAQPAEAGPRATPLRPVRAGQTPGEPVVAAAADAPTDANLRDQSADMIAPGDAAEAARPAKAPGRVIHGVPTADHGVAPPASVPGVVGPGIRWGSAQDGAQATILLAEDEAPVRAFVARALRLKGFAVIEAVDGEQALAVLSDPQIRVDLFITDVIMPAIDGPAWVTKALEKRPGTPVVFMSGYAEDAVNEALSRIPHSAFLSKPFSLQELTKLAAAQLIEPA